LSIVSASEANNISVSGAKSIVICERSKQHLPLVRERSEHYVLLSGAKNLSSCERSEQYNIERAKISLASVASNISLIGAKIIFLCELSEQYVFLSGEENLSCDYREQYLFYIPRASEGGAMLFLPLRSAKNKAL
jgi:hypothetical protein